MTSSAPAGPATSSSDERARFFDRLSELAPTAPPPAYERGDHSIRGRVVTIDGRPLAGTRVSAWSKTVRWPESRRHAFDNTWRDRSLARSLRASATNWYAFEEKRRETTTAADGTFELAALIDGTFEVEAWCDGYRVEPVNSTFEYRMTVPVDAVVDFIAFPLVTKRIELRLPDGSAPAEATLRLDRVGARGGGETETWRPADPFVPLPVGEWNVTAMVFDPPTNMIDPREAAFASRPTHVTAAADGAGDVVTVELHGAVSIVGEIRQAAGTRASACGVSAIELLPGDEPDPALLRTDDPRRTRRIQRESAQWTSDRTIWYRIHDLKRGRWLVGVRIDGSEMPCATAVVHVGGGVGVARQDFDLTSLTADVDLRLRVVDPAGDALRDCEFESRAAHSIFNGKKQWTGGWPDAKRLLDGGYAVTRRLPGAKDGLRDYLLIVRHPRFGERAFDVPPDAREFTARFEAPACPTLRLVGGAELVAARRLSVEVTEQRERDVELRERRFEADAIARDGTLELGCFQPGRYLLRLVLAPSPAARPEPWGGKGEHEIAVVRLDLASGARDLELRVPELFELRLAGAKKRDAFTLGSVDAAALDQTRVNRHAEADEDGTCVFVELPRGDYELCGPIGTTMLVEVPAPGVVRFSADAIRALRVAIRDPEGGLAKAGLATGDWIVAVDGREFGSREELNALRKALHDELVTLTVERDGNRFEIALARALFEAKGGAGGFLIESPR